MTKSDELLTAPEVGHILGYSAKTILRRYESLGLILVQKLPGPNGAHLFRRSQVEAIKKAAS